MVATRKHDYGLELTQNSKVGWAFSLARKESCIDATEICKKLCYGNGVRYHSNAQKHKRLRNYKTCKFLLAQGGPELLACNLVAVIDQARPVDWLAAEISGEETNLPYTLRIHDIGDFFSSEYAEAWQIAVRQRPQCKFWFYTRSFLRMELLAALSELAAEPNCQGFLSIDNDNFERGFQAFTSYPGIWKLAFMQQKEDELSGTLIPILKKTVSVGDVISFPVHRGGHHVKPLKTEPLTICPQITSNAFPLQTSRAQIKPCQACGLCLP